MTAISFAKAGLVKHPSGPDSATCPWCEYICCNFKATVDVVALHKAYAGESCEFIKHYSITNIPLASRKLEGQPAGYLDLPSSIRGNSPSLLWRSTVSTILQHNYRDIMATAESNKFAILCRLIGKIRLHYINLPDLPTLHSADYQCNILYRGFMQWVSDIEFWTRVACISISLDLCITYWYNGGSGLTNTG